MSWPDGWRAHAVVLAFGLAALLVCHGPATAQAREGDRAGRMTLQTFPRVAGMRVLHRGRVHLTDRRGRVTLDVTVFPRMRATPRGYLAFAAPKILTTKLPGGREGRFGGYFKAGKVIGVSLYSRTRLRYVSPKGRAIDADTIRAVTLQSRTGERLTLRGEHSPLLQASRVVAFRDGPHSKSIEWSVEAVDVGGGNVINRAQQRFAPSRTRELTLQLLLYAARFTSRDALFRYNAGSAIILTYPSGRVVRIPLEDGEATSGDLPRGDYMVTVEASGMAFERPVSLSRDQVVDLEVLSYVDLAVVFGSLAALAIGLVLARRPVYRRRIRRLVPLRRRSRVAA